MKKRNIIKKALPYILIIIILLSIVLLVITILTKKSQANEWFYARKYNFTDDEIRRIASMCVKENGSSVDAMRAEASLMANLYEKHRKEPYTTAGLINYITTSGWFASVSVNAYHNPFNVKAEYIEAVKDVLINGNRYFPVYVDEHDCLSDITSVSNNGVTFNKSNRDNYIPGVTIIKNCYGSTYTFYCFPDSIADPFGYMNINTNAGEITSIKVDTLPEKTDYFVEDEVDLTEIKLIAEYDNGTWKYVTEGFGFSPETLNTEGNQKITITYEGKETEFEVNVKKEDPIVNIQYEKNSIFEGEKLPEITLAEGDTEGSVNWDNYILEIGTKNYKWTFIPKNTNRYNNKTGEVQITVIEKKIEEVKIQTAPQKVEYKEGENFDATGMKVVAIYNDGSTKEVTNYIVVDGNNLNEEKTNVTISYTEKGETKTIKQEIIVKEKLKIEIEDYIENKEDKNSYIENISPKTTIENITSKIQTNGKVEVYKGTQKIIDPTTKLGTGMKIKITLNSEYLEYIVVVKGDLTGDGEMGDADLLRMTRFKAGLDKNLTGAYLKATDINNNNENADDIDLLKLLRILVGLDSF